MEQTRKSFATLHEDYAFFEAHGNEAQAGIAAWVPLLAGRTGLRVLDFGAGSGSFTHEFLRAVGWDPQKLELTLVEPEVGFREQALQRLAPFSRRPVTAWPLLDRELPESFDVILSHHVLYYVPDLDETLGRLWRCLANGGRMLLAQAGERNGLNRIMRCGFERLGEGVPYFLSEDTRRALQRAGIPFREQVVPSQVDFADSEENRLKIARFLLGQHAARLPQGELVSLFEPFRRAERIHIDSSDELFILDKGVV